MKDKQPSLFTASKRGILSTVFLYLFIFVIGLPVVLIFVNADKLGIFWFPLILLYCALLMVITYMLGKYRALMSVMVDFSEKEFAELYPKDYKFIKSIEKVNIIEKLLKN